MKKKNNRTGRTNFVADQVKGELKAFTQAPISDNKSELAFELTAENFINTKPFASKRFAARLLNALFRLPLAVMKRALRNYAIHRLSVDNRVVGSLNNIEPTINGFESMLNQKVYEMMKLTDALKSELMAEINKGASPVSGGEKVKTEIINRDKVQTCKKLNVGSGSHILDDYINIDHRAIKGVDLVADIQDLPIKPGTIEEILAAHVVEHFTELKMKDILNYWYSLLKKNGSMRIIVPDIGSMAKGFASGEIEWNRLRRVVLGGQDYNSDYHFNMFSKEYLVSFAQEALPDAEVTLVAQGRPNGEALELEVVVKKP